MVSFFIYMLGLFRCLHQVLPKALSVFGTCSQRAVCLSNTKFDHSQSTLYTRCLAGCNLWLMMSTVTILIGLQVHWDISDFPVTERTDCETLLYKYCCYVLRVIEMTTTTTMTMTRTLGMQYMMCHLQRLPKLI